MATDAKSTNTGSRRLASPILGSDIPHRSWKTKLEMRTLISGIHKKGQQFVCKNKKTEKAVSNLTPVELHRENGLNSLLGKLCIAFQSDYVEDSYNIYLTFSYLKLQSDISKND